MNRIAREAEHVAKRVKIGRGQDAFDAIAGVNAQAEAEGGADGPEQQFERRVFGDEDGLESGRAAGEAPFIAGETSGAHLLMQPAQIGESKHVPSIAEEERNHLTGLAERVGGQSIFHVGENALLGGAWKLADALENGAGLARWGLRRVWPALSRPRKEIGPSK